MGRFLNYASTFVSWICQRYLTSSPNLSPSLHLTVDIKNNSEDILSNLRQVTLPVKTMTEKSMYDTQIKPVHPTDSHEGYVIVEFTLQDLNF